MKKVFFSMALLLAGPVCFATDLHPKFERMLPNESALYENIVLGITDLQEKNRASGKKLRGTHAKGVCALADFSFDAEKVPAFMKVGFFSRSGSYPAFMRFANAESKIQSDFEPDVRSASFAVLNVPAEISNSAGRMDFSMNDADTFPIQNAKVFSDLMTLSRKGLSGVLEIGISGAWEVKKAFALGDAQKKVATLGYQNLWYWSGVPFLMGDAAVKYSLEPCSGNVSMPLDRNNPDALTANLATDLRSNPKMTCFDFKIQFLDESFASQRKGIPHWIEDVTQSWPKETMPFISVGKVVLRKGVMVPTEQCESWQFSVSKYTSPLHRGLGSINRARTYGEEASGRNRSQ